MLFNEKIFQNIFFSNTQRKKTLKSHWISFLAYVQWKLNIICCTCSMKIELQNFLSMEYNIFFTTECRPSMEIVVPRCSCQSPTAKTIVRLHQGITISIEGLHLVIIRFLFLIGPKLWGLHVISGILKGYKVF